MCVPEHFLVIGAQKCGSTTLHADLGTHPGVRLAEKESSPLLRVDASSPSAVADYQQMLGPGRDLRWGDVSTQYSMLPRIDAADLARRVFDDLQVVYIVRHPIDRVLSHHHHLFAAGDLPADVDEAVARFPELVDNSRYAMQITPWIDAFGRDRVHVIRFESYMSDRDHGFADLLRFLALPDRPLSSAGVHNAAADRRLATGGWRRVRTNALYRRGVRRVVPAKVRARVLSRILPSPPPPPAPPSEETMEMLRRELAPEVERLEVLLGTEPWWDLAEEGTRS